MYLKVCTIDARETWSPVPPLHARFATHGSFPSDGTPHLLLLVASEWGAVKNYLATHTKPNNHTHETDSREGKYCPPPPPPPPT